MKPPPSMLHRLSAILAILLVLLTAYPTAPAFPQAVGWPDTPEIVSLKDYLASVEAEKGSDHPDLVDLLEQLGGAYAMLGGYVRATPYFERELAILDSGPERDTLRLVLMLELLGTVYCLQGDTGRARTIRLRALPIVERHLGLDHPAYGVTMLGLAELHLLAGNTRAAEGAFDTAWTTLRVHLFQAAHEWTDVNRRAGLVQLALGRYREAERQLVYAMTVRSEALDLLAGETDRAEGLLYVAPLQIALGTLYAAVGLYDRAEPLLRDALGAYEKEYGKDHPFLGETLANLAATYAGKGDATRSREYGQRALAVHRRGLGYAYVPDWPVRPPARAVSSDPPEGPFADARVGDEAIYESGTGIPVQKRAIVTVTPVVVVVQTLNWDSAGSWTPGQEHIEARSQAEAAETSVGSDIVIVGGQRISCRILVTSGEENVRLWVADTVPAGGLVKMERDGEVILRLREFRRGHE